ncbi:MAG: sensor histidine kinase [Vicinamibacterales bacterium]
MTVVADPRRLEQALQNLASNALRHTPAGGRVTVSAEQQDGTTWLRVADTGSGIPAEHLPYVFDRFYKADPARSESGSGLGLSIVKAIVERHGGRVRARSTPGVETVFEVEIAAAVGAAEGRMAQRAADGAERRRWRRAPQMTQSAADGDAPSAADDAEGADGIGHWARRVGPSLRHGSTSGEGRLLSSVRSAIQLRLQTRLVDPSVSSLDVGRGESSHSRSRPPVAIGDETKLRFHAKCETGRSDGGFHADEQVNACATVARGVSDFGGQAIEAGSDTGVGIEADVQRSDRGRSIA